MHFPRDSCRGAWLCRRFELIFKNVWHQIMLCRRHDPTFTFPAENGEGPWMDSHIAWGVFLQKLPNFYSLFSSHENVCSFTSENRTDWNWYIFLGSGEWKNASDDIPTSKLSIIHSLCLYISRYLKPAAHVWNCIMQFLWSFMKPCKFWNSS